jgi:hypothetical protein
MENHNANFIVAGSGRARRLRLYRGNAGTHAGRNLSTGPTPTPTPTNDGRDAGALLTRHRGDRTARPSKLAEQEARSVKSEIGIGVSGPAACVPRMVG